MAEFEIEDGQLSVLKDKVVVLTGSSSGIGLATLELLVSLGAKVVAGDINPLPSTITQNPDLVFVTTNVSSWSDLVNLFKVAVSHYGRVDHTFANAGIGPTTNYLDLKNDPSTGDLLEPSSRTYDVNLTGMLNTSAIAFHHMRQQPTPGSVVVTASASAFQRFSMVDYAVSKHGVLGFMRGMVPALRSQGLSEKIRINAIAPSWTVTGLVPAGMAEAAGKQSQGPDVVARSVALLMADESRTGHLIYSEGGKFSEVDEGLFLKLVGEAIFRGGLDDNTAMENINRIRKEAEMVKAEADKQKQATAPLE